MTMGKLSEITADRMSGRKIPANRKCHVYLKDKPKTRKESSV